MELFDKKLFKNINTVNQKYHIGIDTYDKDNLAYCLTRTIDKVTEVLLLKRMKDETAFNEEVDNLAKYFNAKKIRG